MSRNIDTIFVDLGDTFRVIRKDTAYETAAKTRICELLGYRTEGIRVPVPLAWGGSSTARVLLRLCPESACQPGPSLELSTRLEAGGCAVGTSPGRLGSLRLPFHP